VFLWRRLEVGGCCSLCSVREEGEQSRRAEQESRGEKVMDKT
jgi:hypothetical protein